MEHGNIEHIESVHWIIWMKKDMEQNDLCSDTEPCLNCRVSSLELKMKVLGFAILITGLYFVYAAAKGIHGE
jgi:hypothetical protein